MVDFKLMLTLQQAAAAADSSVTAVEGLSQGHPLQVLVGEACLVMAEYQVRAEAEAVVEERFQQLLEMVEMEFNQTVEATEEMARMEWAEALLVAVEAMGERMVVEVEV